jgi:hypothetical protein
MLHKHHIIPRHAGGTDDPSNLVMLTPEEHAEAHRILYEQHGKWQDYIAWQGLLGRMTNEEIHRQKSKLANIGKVPWHKGKKIGPRSDETKRKISEKMKGIKKSPNQKRRPMSEETKRKISEAHKRSGHAPTKEATEKSIKSRKNSLNQIT